MVVRGFPMVGFLFVGLGDVGRTTCRFRREGLFWLWSFDNMRGVGCWGFKDLEGSRFGGWG